MPLTFIDSLGFHRGRLSDYVAAVNTLATTIFGSSTDLSPEALDTQYLAGFAQMLADDAELAEAVYNGRSRAGAIGAGLKRLVRLNGVTAKSAGFAIAGITVSGTGGTVIPIGSLVGSDFNKAAIFQTLATITVGTPLATDQVRAVTPGPLPSGVGGIGDLIHPLMVISGWTGVTNPAPSSAGTNAETDPELRSRDEASVALPSQGIIDGLVAALRQTANVSLAEVFENSGETTDANGLPAHSINAIVKGGSSADIAAALWLKKSLGVTQVGANSQDVIDTQGIAHTMRWDQPISVSVYVVVTFASAVSGTVQTQIKTAIVAWGLANSGIGGDVAWSDLFTPINTVVPGLGVNSIAVGSAPSPTAFVNLAIAFNALAGWDASRITVLP